MFTDEFLLCPTCRNETCNCDVLVPPNPFDAGAPHGVIRGHRGGRASECSDGLTHVLRAARPTYERPCYAYAPACGANVETYTLHFRVSTEPRRVTCPDCAKIVTSGEIFALRDKSPARY